MEARVQVEAAREGLLVELAAIGLDGLAALLGESEQASPLAAPGGDELPDLLEAALEAALEAWRSAASGSPATAPAELPSRRHGLRIAALRRRFNEVGASNPFAAAGARRGREPP